LQQLSGDVFVDSEYGFSEYQTEGLILHQFDRCGDNSNPKVDSPQRQIYPCATAVLFVGVFHNAIKLFDM
jgi:hypothetical protein